MATKVKETSIDVLEVTRSRMEFCVLGTSPLILNRMSEKAKRELLLPRGRKNAADKAANLKHNPFQEYRDSPYKSVDPKSPTLLMLMSSGFKGAMRTAALDLPGANKSQIGRLVFVEGDYVNVHGLPKLFMSVTRSADINKTPDIRTRTIVPEWCARVTVSFVTPLLRQQSVANLLAAAGISSGVGDWRPEKGAGSYGQFQLVSADNKDFIRICREGHRAAQVKAMQTPEPYDMETAELLSWFETEATNRGFKVAA